MLQIVPLVCHGRIDVVVIHSTSRMQETLEGYSLLQVLGYSRLKRDCDLEYILGENQTVCEM